ncbi:MarR family winged helix-turn-helix transcriptional regulator [Pseudorhodoferax sp.]|uniref:MarR family winged helix-turn-helix transcriptional regulator n=1 Tax=Pseudorhodoferax sp. TaxID=1993553 RepID=UPI002DD68631|nr:MarR family transcriptional regulator [Pseudorhodoferax sp.]
MTQSTDPESRLVKMFDRPGFLLRRAHQISAGVFEEECREIGLTPAQFAVLMVLEAAPGIDQSSLARAAGYDKVTVMYILRGLIERGLVARAAAAGKKRGMELSLTEEGVRFLASAQQPTEQAAASLMSPFTEAQQKQFIKLLKILTTSLQDRARAPLVLPEAK